MIHRSAVATTNLPAVIRTTDLASLFVEEFFNLPAESSAEINIGETFVIFTGVITFLVVERPAPGYSVPFATRKSRNPINEIETSLARL